MPFQTLLIANRGEIACRIMRTARALGYRTVAVFSPADADAPHVRQADVAVALSGNAPAQSYLDIEQLLSAAGRAGADAVHPGYGFLAENETFAQAVIEAGLIWIGPPPEAIAAMGNKRRAKVLMEQAGVPVIPGARAAGENEQALKAAVDEIGLPVMIKAAAGGGGKGMRLVTKQAELADALRAATSEARSSFGNDELIIEKALINARHVEVQVFADLEGHIIHLGERDCSMQRRHQKIVEECPSPAVDAGLRQAMGEAAVAAAHAIGYVGAGTVEFLLDEDGQFRFLEMNTRLQVEHPVTEWVTSHDLVAWQLQVAAGQALPVSQDEVVFNGHAIEVRLYAEAPEQGFLPQTGRLIAWRPPDGEGIRVDTGVAPDQLIGTHYDPLLAKIIAHGPDRETARRRLLLALEDTVAVGLRTNRAGLVRALEHPEFISGAITTSFVECHGDQVFSAAESTELAAVAAVLLAGLAGNSAWPNRNTRRLRLEVDVGSGPVDCLVRVGCEGDQLFVELDGERLEFDSVRQSGEQVEYAMAGCYRRCVFIEAGQGGWLVGPDADLFVNDLTLSPPVASQAAGEGRITAPMDGTVVEVRAGEGEVVTRGQALLVMEAMKMETTLNADIDGCVSSLTLKSGDSLRKGQVVAVIEPESADHGK
jgi:geranyl-CoA carboxylase alpha subunit